MIKAIERATGNEFKAERIEGGYEVYTLDGEKYKKLKESTFKRNFKVTGETVTDDDFEDETPEKTEQVQPETEEKAEEPQSTKKSEEKSHPKAEKHNVTEELSDEKREQMVEKIKKMLKLAENNPSMEEGLQAALHAHKLMAKYNIHEEDVTLEEIKDEISSVFSHQPHDSHLMRWRKTLASVVAGAFRCKCYMLGKDVVFRGFTDDAKLAMDVYLMLYNVGHNLAKKTETQERAKTGTAKGIYTSVATGFVRGAQDAFNEQCTALLVVTPKQVEEEWVEFSANFKTSKNHLTVSDADAYKKGYDEGKSVVKSRSIEKKGK